MLVMELDAIALEDASKFGIDQVTDATRDYIKGIRNQYNPQVRQYLGLDKPGTNPTDFDEMIIIRRNKREANAEEQPQEASWAELKHKATVIEHELKQSEE